MVGNLSDLLEFSKKLAESIDNLGKASDEDRQKIATYLGKIEQCLLACAEKRRSGEIPEGSWAELKFYAKDLPESISKELGPATAKELAFLLNNTASCKPEQCDISSIETVAGQLRGIAARVLVEPSSNWFQRFIHAKLSIWMIVPLSLLSLLPISYLLTNKPPAASPKTPQITSLLLPANKIWLDTGIKVKPGQKAKIKASGSVTLGIHLLVGAAYTHTKPRRNWAGPEGTTPKQDAGHPRDPSLEPLFIAPEKNPGALLACIAPDHGNGTPGKYHSKPEGIWEIGKDGEIPSFKEGNLWLVVNDVVLNGTAEARDIYLNSPEFPETYYEKEKVTEDQRKKNKRKEWEEIALNKYFEAFFDDNAGEFLVQIEVVQ